MLATWDTNGQDSCSITTETDRLQGITGRRVPEVAKGKQGSGNRIRESAVPAGQGVSERIIRNHALESDFKWQDCLQIVVNIVFRKFFLTALMNWIYMTLVLLKLVQ